MKVAITIPTGRPRVKKVVKAFLDNAVFHGHDLKDFSIYLSIDTSFMDTKVEDFYLDQEVVDSVCKVEYIDETRRRQIGLDVADKCEVDSLVVEKLFYGSGYSKQRNAALFVATKDGNDVAICFDDDEAPQVPLKKRDGELDWKNLDYFGPHFKELSNGADITRGPCLGYLSPVPSDFEKDIPKVIRKKLGDALQWGSDVITRYSFFDLMNKIIYLNEDDLGEEKRPFDVQEGKNGKHIYAGNMGINLNSVRAGKIPVFYTPPSARGEDTIFSLQLIDLVVREVNSFIFHDPFEMYEDILGGKFPEFLKSVPVTLDTKNRFASALIGWLKYAPILISMTSENSEQIENRTNAMLGSIDEPARELADLLSCPQISECKSVLSKYNDDVEEHIAELCKLQRVWKEKIVPNSFNSQVLIAR